MDSQSARALKEFRLTGSWLSFFVPWDVTKKGRPRWLRKRRRWLSLALLRDEAKKWSQMVRLHHFLSARLYFLLVCLSICLYSTADERISVLILYLLQSPCVACQGGWSGGRPLSHCRWRGTRFHHVLFLWISFSYLSRLWRILKLQFSVYNSSISW